MKRILLTFAFVAMATAMNAQSMKLQSAISDSKNDRLDKAKANIDEASTHESTKEDAKTWRYKADIYYKIATTAKEKFKNLDPNPLQVAYESAVKSMQLDTEKEFFNFNYLTIKNINIEYYNKGVESFKNNDFQSALNNFEKGANISKSINDQKGMGDAYYNAAIAAEQLKDKEKVTKIYTELVKIGYANPRVYAIVYQSYKKENDTSKAVAVAEKSANVADKIQAKAKQDGKPVTTYPYYLSLLDAYFWTNNTEKANQIIAGILQSEAANPTVLNELGLILEGVGMHSEAKVKYEESLAIKADQYDGNYNIGAWFFNRGVDKVEEASKVPTNDRTGLYDKLIAESKEYFNSAIPYLEKAISFKENDVRALMGLKQIYARTEQFDKVKEIDAKLSEVNK